MASDGGVCEAHQPTLRRHDPQCRVCGSTTREAEATVHQLVALVDQADRALQATAHDPTCHMAGCTCGAVDQLKSDRAEFYRLWRAWQRGR